MTVDPILDDDRGVDVSLIRTLLAMTPAERLAHMVEVAAKLRSLADHARQARR